MEIARKATKLSQLIGIDQVALIADQRLWPKLPRRIPIRPVADSPHRSYAQTTF